MTRLDAFLEFSSVATAFTVFDLLGTGMAEVYFATLVDVVGPVVAGELLDAFERLPIDESRIEAFRTCIMEDEKFGPVARSLIKLWYIGTWYALPDSWTFGSTPPVGSFVPTRFAYVEGLLWWAVGAHPPAAKPGGYASWTSPPVIPPIPAA